MRSPVPAESTRQVSHLPSAAIPLWPCTVTTRIRSVRRVCDDARQTAQRSASDPTRSWLTVLAADALARVGRSREALATLDAARSQMAGQDEWMYDFDEGSLALNAGTCLLTVWRPENATAAFIDALR